MHAYALEHLEKYLQPGMKGTWMMMEHDFWFTYTDFDSSFTSLALDVGSGSGYLTACMAEMVNARSFSGLIT